MRTTSGRDSRMTSIAFAAVAGEENLVLGELEHAFEQIAVDLVVVDDEQAGRPEIVEVDGLDRVGPGVGGEAGGNRDVGKNQAKHAARPTSLRRGFRRPCARSGGARC